MVRDGEFGGMRCSWMDNGLVRLAVTTDRGPRIVFWGWRNGGNVFAELPDAAEETPNGPYHFLGGHRLWYAPEILERTYYPDDSKLEVQELGEGSRLIAPPDATGVVKEMRITLAPDEATATLEHTLRNTSGVEVELAPWALTMCRLGGTVLLPQPTNPSDAHGLLPNRRISLWPYSRLTDERLHLGDHIVLIRAEPGTRNKLGYLDDEGWIAYWLDGTVFSKRFDVRTDATYPDFGCNAECYLDHRFVELESLGPLVRLSPGGSVSHEEVWQLHPSVSRVETEDEALLLADRLGLRPDASRR